MATKEARLRANKNWKARNPGKIKDMSRGYLKRNRVKMRDQHRKATGKPLPTRAEPDVCECCGKKCEIGSLCLDHDHVTGAFRGWLCRKCNSGIGLLGDSIYHVLMAVDYLLRK